MNQKIKTYVLMVSTKFPACHCLKGEPTLFIEKIKDGTKIHTIRSNYELWKKRFEKINKGEAVLSVRSWEGKPYQSKQIEHFVFTKEDEIGIQEIFIKDWFRELYYSFQIDDKFFPEKGLSYTRWREYYAKLIANNDGLTFDQFKNWFRKYDLNKPMAIIHFTKFRY